MTEPTTARSDVSPELAARQAEVQRIIDHFGTQQALAKAIYPSVHQTTVWLWKANGDIPPERHVPIIEASKALVAEGQKPQPLSLRDFVNLPSGQAYRLALGLDNG